MGHSLNNSIRLQSFEITYNTYIRPRLEALDIFMKTSDIPYNLHDVAALLEISEQTLAQIMRANNIDKLDKISLFHVIFACKTTLCQLIKRQWKYANVSSYTPEMISDIYNLNINIVQGAFEDYEVTEVTEDNLMEIFKRIHTCVYFENK